MARRVRDGRSRAMSALAAMRNATRSVRAAGPRVVAAMLFGGCAFGCNLAGNDENLAGYLALGGLAIIVVLAITALMLLLLAVAFFGCTAVVGWHVVWPSRASRAANAVGAAVGALTAGAWSVGVWALAASSHRSFGVDPHRLKLLVLAVPLLSIALANLVVVLIPERVTLGQRPRC